MQIYQSLDPGFETRVRSSFERQKVMKFIGASLLKVLPGEVHIEFPFNTLLTQQNGYIHAGIITTVIDSACGAAASSLMAPENGVLSIEYKVNFLSPAVGEKFLGIGRVIKAGRNITVCSGEFFAKGNGHDKLVAVMQATMMTMAKNHD